MFEIAKVNCTSKVYVYNEYEIINVENYDDLPGILFSQFSGHNQFELSENEKIRIRKYLYEFKKNDCGYVDIKNRPFKIVVPSSKAYKDTQNNNKFHLYNPIEKRLLTHHYTTISSDEQLLEFFKDYGIPNGLNFMTNGNLFDRIVMFKDIHFSFQFTDLIYKQSNSLYKLQNLWTHIIKKNINEIEQFLKLEGYDKLFLVREDQGNKDIRFDEWIYGALRVINLNIENAGTTSIELVKDKVEPVINFKNLDEVTIFNFKKNLYAGKNEYKQCQNCGNVFESMHSRMRFCPPFLGSAMIRSSCENAWNQKQKRETKKRNFKGAKQNE